MAGQPWNGRSHDPRADPEPSAASIRSAASRCRLLAGGGGERGGDVHYHRHFSPDITVEGALRQVETRDDLIESLQDLSRMED